MGRPFPLTTPIYYVNSVPHIGTALTTLAADATARWMRMRGCDTFFLTGTDENGLKIQEAAERAGKDTQAFVDEIAEGFRAIWPEMHIAFDDFIRTTEPRHVEAVQRFFRILLDNGSIYRGKYEGWYDVSTETFYREADLVDGKSPEGNEVRWVSEENYFFRLSAYGDALLAHIDAHPGFILPEVRRNEVVAFIRQGLRDTCISRTNPGWGIPVPDDPEKVVYVWFDALINYVSATGWPAEGWEAKWPAEVQWMAKDILTRFHATLWPAMLIAAGLPLPGVLVGHGFLTMEGRKISKSLGNVVAPYELAQKLSEVSGATISVSVDAVRYHLLATIPYENDRDFTYEDFFRKYNADLANDLGNALNRTLAMTHKFAEGKVPDGEVEAPAQEAIALAIASADAAMAEYRLDRVCESAIGLVRFLNKYIDTRAPWALAKAGDPALASVLRSMLVCLRAAEGLLRPAMPVAADEIARQLGLAPLADASQIGVASAYPAGTPVLDPQPIFPRIDLTKVETPKAPKPAKPAAPPPKPMEEIKTEEIGIEEFARIKFRVGRVLEAEPVEGSDKLLKLQVMIGEEKRQIVAGIRNNYSPIDLIGRQVVVVANLKPAKLRGVESQGMLLAATDESGGAILLQPDKEAPEGATVR